MICLEAKKGIMTLVAVIAIQLTLGIAYIWSVFQTGIAESIFGGDHAAASLTFSLLLATLTVGGVIGGKLTGRFSTRAVVLTGGLILSLGFFLASLVTENNAWLLWVTYGIMGGLGMGFSYTTTIAIVQKWYPHKKGLVTGIIVSSLGFGGVVFTPIVERLIIYFGGEGTGELNTFMVLSIVFLIVCTVGSLFLKNPPDGWKAGATPSQAAKIKAKKDYSPMEMIKSPKFFLVVFSLMLACMGGLMMIGFAKPIAVAKGMSETATIGVLAISLCNSFGRLGWGQVSDKIGRRNTIMILLLGSATCSLLVNMAQGYWIYILIGLIGLFYGGFLSNFPALTADMFGAKYMATNYGIILLGFGAGAIISSQIAGYYKNVAANDISLMYPAFVIAAGCALAAFGMILILKYKKKWGV
jgi:OFA family oxalate/formate antiporter-like MFS transporter